MTHKERAFYKELGICPICHKNKLFGDEKSCLECKANEANYKSLSREVKREEYNLYMRIYQKQIYDARKEKRICTTCGKRKAESGYATCDTCRTKRLKNRRIKCYKTLTRYERGLCRFCDNPVEDGYKVCEYHHRLNIEKANNEKSKKAREKNRNIILR